MTDVETPPTHRTETVSRVLAAISTGTSDNELDREVLQVALASEGRSLLDLPEVGLWLALTEMALTEPHAPTGGADVVVIDLRDDAPTGPLLDDTALPGVPTSATARALAAIDEDVIDVDSVELDPGVVGRAEPGTDASPSTAAPSPAPSRPLRRQRRAARLGRRQKLPPIVAAPEPVVAAPEPVPPAPASATPEASHVPDAAPDDPPWPTGLAALLGDLETHLRTVLSEPVMVDVHDPASVGTSSVERPPVDPLGAVAFVPVLQAYLETALAGPLTIRLPDDARHGTATPDPWWPPALARSLAELDTHLRTVLAHPVAVPLRDPSVPGTAGVEPYWPPTLVRTLTTLSAYLRAELDRPTSGRAPASRLAGATNGAEPDRYWPRHLVRSGTDELPVDDLADLPSAPRSSEQLEHDLQSAIDAVALIGEADLDSFAAETQISLSRLVRREPLDRLGRVYPATLAAFLVRQTRLHPSPTEFDALVPISALRRTNPVGLAFSEALVRLSKPVFREVEQRDEFDHRVRYLRRMQLHVGITPDLVPTVLDAVIASHWAGARSGREVAQDWLSAHRAVSSVIGDPTFRLLTRTDHGARMLEALLDLVRWRCSDPTPDAAPAVPDPLPPALVDVAWARLAAGALPLGPWGERGRPLLRLGREPGSGPELELPRNASRWHLNGELLGYGSATHCKTVPLPTSRSGKWAVTVGTTRRASPHDIGIQSAADDRIVLVFDESGRFHHHVLPLGGRTATVIAPSGSRVDGEAERTLLVDRWIGFERIEVDLTDRTEISVSQRGRAQVTVAVDHRLGAHLLAANSDAPQRLSRLVFRGHVPPTAEVEVIVADGRTRHTSMLADLWIDDERGSFGLDHLVDPGPPRTVTLTVTREGFEPAVHGLAVPGTPASPAPAATVRTPPLVAESADVALRRLVGALASALSAAVAEDDDDARDDPLAAHVWEAAITEDLERLAAWEQRHRRPLRQWRSTATTLANLDPLWAAHRSSERGRIVLPLLTAGLLAALDGAHRDLATRWSNDARLLAPHLGECVAAFAAAYGEIRTNHPESRFRPIDLD